LTEADLINAFKRGDRGAFNDLVRLWHPRIYNFVLRYAGDRDEAADLAQQTFIRAYSALSKLENPEKSSTWIYQIALNASRDAGRTRQRRPTVDVDDENIAAALGDDVLSRPDAVAHERDVRDLLNRALQTLPEEQRVVVIMKEYEGLKLREIADALDVSINTVKSRLYRVFESLKHLFELCCITEEMLRYDA